MKPSGNKSHPAVSEVNKNNKNDRKYTMITKYQWTEWTKQKKFYSWMISWWANTMGKDHSVKTTLKRLRKIDDHDTHTHIKRANKQGSRGHRSTYSRCMGITTKTTLLGNFYLLQWFWCFYCLICRCQFSQCFWYCFLNINIKQRLISYRILMDVQLTEFSCHFRSC